MITTKHLQTLFFICTLSITGYSQTNNEREIGGFEEFWDYSGWGFFVTPVIYQKPITSNTIGVIPITSVQKKSFQFGAKRYFSRTFKWSFNAGITANFTPSPNFRYDITTKIIDDYTYSGFDNPYDGLNGVSFTIPLQMEYKQRLGKKIYINFSAGFDVGFGSGITAIYQDRIQKKIDANSQITVFTIKLDNSGFLAGSQLKGGFYINFDTFLLQTNLLYNKSLLNLWEGEYRFSSLLNSERTTGRYKQSGDYFGLSTTVFFKRKK